MILGRVVGRVWATRQDARLGGSKLLVIRPHGVYEPALATRHLVAVDDVDAGVGDDVIVALGRPARLAIALISVSATNALTRARRDREIQPMRGRPQEPSTPARSRRETGWGGPQGASGSSR